jgi:hypothetical protein
MAYSSIKFRVMASATLVRLSFLYTRPLTHAMQTYVENNLSHSWDRFQADAIPEPLNPSG